MLCFKLVRPSCYEHNMFEKIDLTFDGLRILLTGYNQLIREKQKPSLYSHVFLGMTSAPSEWGGRDFREDWGFMASGPAVKVTEFTLSSSVYCPGSDEWETLLP